MIVVQFDLYYPQGASKVPVVFWVHGGGYVVVVVNKEGAKRICDLLSRSRTSGSGFIEL